MFKTGDIVKICDYVNIFDWYTHDLYKIINNNGALCTVYNINTCREDVFYFEFLECALKEYRKQKLEKICSKSVLE